MTYLLLNILGHPTTPVQHPHVQQGDASINASTSTPIQQTSQATNMSQASISTLSPPFVVVEKYPMLKCMSRMPTLAVKLARESFFGKNMMVKCTVQGCREHPPLPPETLSKLKTFLSHLFVEKCTKPEFEGKWKICLNSIGQACKALRLAAKRQGL